MAGSGTRSLPANWTDCVATSVLRSGIRYRLGVPRIAGPLPFAAAAKAKTPVKEVKQNTQEFLEWIFVDSHRKAPTRKVWSVRGQQPADTRSRVYRYDRAWLRAFAAVAVGLLHFSEVR